jgi:hypothetical protein
VRRGLLVGQYLGFGEASATSSPVIAPARTTSRHWLRGALRLHRRCLAHRRCGELLAVNVNELAGPRPLVADRRAAEAPAPQALDLGDPFIRGCAGGQVVSATTTFTSQLRMNNLHSFDT